MDILLINANPVVSRMMALCTRDGVYHLEEVSDATGAQKAHYDIIFVDDGSYTTATEDLLKRVEVSQKVLLASKKMEKESKFDRVIRKPFLPSQIVDLLEGRDETPVESIESESVEKIGMDDDLVSETVSEEKVSEEDDPFGLTFEELLDLSESESPQEVSETSEQGVKSETEEESADREALFDLDLEAAVDLPEPDKDKEHENETERLELIDLEISASDEESAKEEDQEDLSDLNFEELVNLSEAEEEDSASEVSGEMPVDLSEKRVEAVSEDEREENPDLLEVEVEEEKNEEAREEIVDWGDDEGVALGGSEREEDAVAASEDQKEEKPDLAEAEEDQASEASKESPVDLGEDVTGRPGASESEEDGASVPEDERETVEDAEMLAEPTEQILAETVLDKTEIDKIKALIEEESECETPAEEALTPEEYESRKIEVIKEDLIAQGLEIVNEEDFVKELGAESEAVGEKQKKPKRKKKLTLEEIDRLEMMFAYTIRRGKPKKLRKLLKGKKVKLKLKDID